MTLSQLIARAKDAKAKYGDMPVTVYESAPKPGLTVKDAMITVRDLSDGHGVVKPGVEQFILLP